MAGSKTRAGGAKPAAGAGTLALGPRPTVYARSVFLHRFTRASGMRPLPDFQGYGSAVSHGSFSASATSATNREDLFCPPFS
jgi:hypothetical protein